MGISCTKNIFSPYYVYHRMIACHQESKRLKLLIRRLTTLQLHCLSKLVGYYDGSVACSAVQWWPYVSNSRGWLQILPLLLALLPPLHMLAKTILFFYRANWRALLLSGLKHICLPEHSSSVGFLVNQSNESTQSFYIFLDTL